MPKESSSKGKIYQLKATLRGSAPPIWRRLLVPGDTTLYDLHKIIQVAMGWTNSHLHQFVIEGEYFAIPSEDEWEPSHDERKYRLKQIAPKENTSFVYEYDFGDGWEHEIIVEKILPPDSILTYPICLAGKRACPPEDVGGIWGYEEFLEAINDPDHEEHESFLEWGGEEFDSEAFDAGEANKLLKNIDKMIWFDE